MYVIPGDKIYMSNYSKLFIYVSTLVVVVLSLVKIVDLFKEIKGNTSCGRGGWGIGDH